MRTFVERASRLWNDGELGHVREAVLAAPLRSHPSAHVYVENVFSSEVYASMLELFPTDERSFRREADPNDGAPRFANYAQRQELRIPGEEGRLDPEQREFWMAMHALICGSDFARVLLERFAPYARARFGAKLDHASFADDHLLGTMLLNRLEPDYYLGPHTDRYEKVFTCLFYFPERAGLDGLGTSLYHPREPGFSCKGVAHHDPAGFERGETMPYRPNSALIFARTNVMFHGVHRLTADDLQGSRRRGIQMQFFVRNERPHEECRVTLQASLPTAMRAGAREQIAYRLTNRSNSELVSSFPYTTQLGYRWFDGAGGLLEQSASDVMTEPLAAGATREGVLPVVAPRTPGRHRLSCSVVQQNVAWFDDLDPANGVGALVWVADEPAVEPTSASELAVARADIVPDSHDVALGAGWFPVERQGSTVFRWVENGAVVHVAALKPLRHNVSLLVEPGPGVRLAPFELTARLADGRLLGAAVVATKQSVSFPLPAESPVVFSIALHAAGGGRLTPHDSRVLNFRVFNVAVERVADVFPAWAQPGEGFYELERHGGATFRWVGGAATIAVRRVRGTDLIFDAEPGPGLGSAPFTLRVTGPDGQDVARVTVASRTTVEVPLARFASETILTLHAEGGARALESGDPRALNFRVFAAE